MSSFHLLWLTVISIYASHVSAAIPVYRSVDSRYNSGGADLNQLENSIEKITPKIWKKISWKGKSYWAPSEQLLSSSHFVKYASPKVDTKVYSEPNLKLPPSAELKASDKLQIISHDSPWAEVSSIEKPGSKFWIEISDLNPLRPSEGYLFSLDKAILYKEADASSKVLTLLNPETRLSIIGWAPQSENLWLKVRFGQLSGFVLPEQSLGVWQLANRIKVSNKWISIPSGKSPLSVLQSAGSTSLAQIEDLSFDEKLNLTGPLGAQLREMPTSASPIVEEIDPGVAVVVEEVQRQLWAKGHLEHIGNVWWKIEKTPHWQTKKNQLTASEFFKRQLFDMVRSPKKKNLVIASARGIFISEDGFHWQPLNKFKDTDYPLAVSSNGKIFVGPYASTDDAETFQPYIRWDKFLLSLQKSLPSFRHTPLDQARIEKIIAKDANGDHLHLIFKIGKREISAWTKNGGDSWFFSQEKTSIQQNNSKLKR